MSNDDPITTCLTCGQQFGYRVPKTPERGRSYAPRSCYECRAAAADWDDLAGPDAPLSQKQRHHSRLGE